MHKKANVMTIEQIKKKLRSGDFVTLGEMLGITPDSARMRFRRGKVEAINGIEKIIATRELLLQSSNK